MARCRPIAPASPPGCSKPDIAQALAAETLQELWHRLRGYDPHPEAPEEAGFLARFFRRKPVPEAPEGTPNGLYIVGEVGRGKSMLMDLFFAFADVRRKQRIHFHRFMQNVHARFHAFRRANPDIDDPIPPLADSIAADAALLCFDEFQVNDIADAMILGRLFQALFERGVVVVATSNIAPDDLFKGQPGRDAFLPFIALIKQRLDVVMMDAGRDFRRLRMRGLRTWLVPADARADRELDRAFAELTGGAEGKPETLWVMGRSFVVPLAARRRGALRLRPAVRHRTRRRRLPRAGGAFPHADPRRHPAPVTRQLRPRAPLHRADRYAVRSSRQAARIGRCDAGPAVSARRERANVRAHRLAADEMQSQDWLDLPHLT